MFGSFTAVMVENHLWNTVHLAEGHFHGGNVSTAAALGGLAQGRERRAVRFQGNGKQRLLKRAVFLQKLHTFESLPLKI